MNYRKILFCHFIFLFVSCYNNSKKTVQTEKSLNKIDSVIVFGDSLSDNGNIYHLSKISASLGFTDPIPDEKKYPKHSFSNGDVWVDILLKHLNISYNQREKCYTQFIAEESCNYAFGSLTTAATSTIEIPFFRKIKNLLESLSEANIIPNLKIPSMFGVKELIYFYINSVKTEKDNSKMVFIIWGGGNDFLNNPEIDNKIVLNNIISSITKIYSLKSMNKDVSVLVPNLPNLGRLPYVLINKEKYNDIREKINRYNNLLSFEIENLNLKYDNKIIYFDVFKKIEDIIKNKQNYNIENTEHACLQENSDTPCYNPNAFVFWDNIHPTHFIHCLIAKEVNEIFKIHKLVDKRVKNILC